MLEYAISRLILVWTMATRLPTVIVTNASTPNRTAHSGLMLGNAPLKMRRMTAKPAAFEPTEKNAVAGVAAPWYTSGVQSWNGAAAILKPSPATSIVTLSSAAGDGAPVSTREMSTSVVAPLTPYSKAMPYSRMAVDMALSRKNLMPASVALSPCPAIASRLFQAARNDNDRLVTSSAR